MLESVHNRQRSSMCQGRHMAVNPNTASSLQTSAFVLENGRNATIWCLIWKTEAKDGIFQMHVKQEDDFVICQGLCLKFSHSCRSEWDYNSL